MLKTLLSLFFFLTISFVARPDTLVSKVESLEVSDELTKKIESLGATTDTPMGHNESAQKEVEKKQQKQEPKPIRGQESGKTKEHGREAGRDVEQEQGLEREEEQGQEEELKPGQGQEQGQTEGHGVEQGQGQTPEQGEEQEQEQENEEKQIFDIRIFSPCYAVKLPAYNDDLALDGLLDDLQVDNAKQAEGSVDEMFVDEREEIKKNNNIYIGLSAENIYLTPIVNREKISKATQKIYKKMSKNFNFLKIYNIKYSENFCEKATDFIKDDATLGMQDYVLTSGDLEDTKYVFYVEVESIDKNAAKYTLFLWDVVNKQMLDSKYFVFEMKSGLESVLADKISDFILANIEGERSGIFDSRILYISETGTPRYRIKQVFLANFLGDEKIKITSGRNTKVTPIFSRKNYEEIFYNEQLEDGFFVIKHNLITGQKQIITRDGLLMTTSPAFHPRENKILVSGTDEDGNTNLYLFDLENQTNRQVTNGKAINTAASFSPDGNQIVYMTDKDGPRKLYIKNMADGKEYLLTKNNGSYDKPSWSPDGKTIAFTKSAGGNFSLGLIDIDGENERYLKKNFLIEGVKWAPNSRFLMYTKQNGVFGKESIPKIFILDIKTGYEVELPLPPKNGASDIDLILN
jgi:TolB protein